MSEPAEPAKGGQRDSEGEESEVSEKPRVKQEDKSDAGERAKVKRHVELKDHRENKRKAAVAALAQAELVARAASLVKAGRRGTCLLP